MIASTSLQRHGGEPILVGSKISTSSKPNRFELLVKMVGTSSTVGLRHCIGSVDVSYRLPMPAADCIAVLDHALGGLKRLDLGGAPVSVF